MAITVPDIPDQPMPDVQFKGDVPLEAFGGGDSAERVNQETQKIAQTTGELAAIEKVRADQTAYQEAAAKLGGAASDILQTKVLSSKGVNAIPAHDEGWTDFRKTANDISGTLNGEAQKGAFNRYALTLGQEFNRTSQAHVRTQLDEHDKNTYNAFVKNTTDFGAMNYGDPITRQRSLEDLNSATVNYAKRNGLGPEETKLLQTSVTSNYHEQTIDTMLKDPRFAPVAREYYDANKDQINLKTRESIDKTLGEGESRYGAQSAVVNILQKNPDSEADALKAADKIDDADTRDMARKMISTKFSQDRQAVRNDQDNTFMQMGKMVDQKGLTDPVDIRNAVPPAEWSQLREDQRTALLKRGTESVTSIPKWLDFKEAVQNDKITKMSRADLETKFLPYFSQEDKKTAVTQWMNGQKGGPKLASDQTTEQAIQNNLITAGLIAPTAKVRNQSKDQMALLASTQGNVHRDILAFESSNNRSPKPEEIQGMIDKQVVNTIGNRPKSFWSIFSSKAPVAYEAIPEKAREQAVQLARSVGGQATKQNIEKAYALHRQGKSDDEIAKVFK